MEEIQLPDEIILTEILPRFPVESLLRFTTVCKRWCQWISDPQFKLSTQRRRIIIFDKLRRNLLNVDPFLCIHEEHCSLQSILEPMKDQSSLHLLGSCNGFILIGLNTSIFLWNLSIRACKEVLQHDMLRLDYGRKSNFMSGLCYDSRTDDYKVVIRLILFGDQRFEFSSLRRKCWKKVDNFPSNRIVVQGRSCWAVVNGNQHWLVKKKLNHPHHHNNNNHFEEAIIYFDGEAEKFNEIQIPIPTGGSGGYRYGLGQLDGCLALSRQCNDKGSAIEIWVMKNYNVLECSWSLCFECPVNSWFQFAMQPLCITKDGGDVLMVQDRKVILAYSTKKEKSRNIRWYNLSHSIVAAQYVESLVSPSAATRP